MSASEIQSQDPAPKSPASAPTGEPPVPKAAVEQAKEAAAKEPPAPTRAVRLPAGIVGAGLTEVERTVPVDEPPPLPPNAQLSVIGNPNAAP